MRRWRPSGPRHGAPASAAAAAGLTVLALVAAGCTVRVRPDPTTTSAGSRPVAAATTTTGPATHGTTVASRAFTLVRGNDRTRVGPAAPGPLPVAMRGTVESLDEAVGLVLVFPLVRARPACVRQVELWLRVLRLDSEPDLAAYPSSLVALASAQPATRVASDTLLDNRPRGTGSLTGDRHWLDFDITELYRTWAEGGPFPSLDRTVRGGRRWSSTSGRPPTSCRCSRAGSRPSATTGRPRPSCAGRRPTTAEPPLPPEDDPNIGPPADGRSRDRW